MAKASGNGGLSDLSINGINELYGTLLWYYSRDDYDVMGTVGHPYYAGRSVGQLGTAYNTVHVSKSAYMDIHAADDGIIFLLWNSRNECI